MTHLLFFLLFFTGPSITLIYTLSLHDALPISERAWWVTSTPKRDRTPTASHTCTASLLPFAATEGASRDRKSTRLNSSHQIISYAVFCLKKKTHVVF